MILAMPPPMTRPTHSRPRPQSPAATTTSTPASTLGPLLPPIATLPSISISPLHRSVHSSHSPSRSDSHTFVHSYSPSHSVPPLVNSRLRSCRLMGCANFAKIHGYCAAHYHDDEATSASATTTTPSVTPTARLPSLRLDHAHAMERPRLPQPPAPIVYATSMTITTESTPSHGRSHTYSPSFGPYAPQLPSLSIPRFAASEPATTAAIPRLASLPRVSPLHRLHPTGDDAFAHFRRAKPTNLKVSPTHSTGSADASPSANPSLTPKAKCRREHCENAARRKGLCMEHGGRHFCKMDGCQKCAHRGGYCIAHGGGRRCAVANCTKSAQSGGVCYSHGGGKRCATDGCSHAARSGGFCIKHGKMAKATTTNADDSE